MPDSVVARSAMLSRALLHPHPQRLAHSGAVAATVAAAANALGLPDSDLVTAAAWLHDIGYADTLAHHRFHPFDGATHLQQAGYHPLIVSLVAHHSCAALEARRNGLLPQHGRFPPPPGHLLDLLDYADATVSPTGRRQPVHARLAEAAHRNHPEPSRYDTVLAGARPRRAAVARVQHRLAALETTPHPQPSQPRPHRASPDAQDRRPRPASTLIPIDLTSPATDPADHTRPRGRTG